MLIHYTKEPSLHPHQDSNSEQRFWRPLWYHFTMRMFVEIGGLEPPTFDVSDQRSNQLSYTSMCRECQIRTDGLFLPKEARYRTTLIPYDVIPLGLEPKTSSLKVKSSTNWATKSYCGICGNRITLLWFFRPAYAPAIPKFRLCLQMDSNHRTPKRTDLQSVAIAAMRYRHKCRRYRIRTYDPLDVNQML